MGHAGETELSQEMDCLRAVIRDGVDELREEIRAGLDRVCAARTAAVPAISVAQVGHLHLVGLRGVGIEEAVAIQKLLDQAGPPAVVFRVKDE